MAFLGPGTLQDPHRRTRASLRALQTCSLWGSRRVTFDCLGQAQRRFISPFQSVKMQRCSGGRLPPTLRLHRFETRTARFLLHLIINMHATGLAAHQACRPRRSRLYGSASLNGSQPRRRVVAALRQRSAPNPYPRHDSWRHPGWLQMNHARLCFSSLLFALSTVPERRNEASRWSRGRA